MPAKFDDVLPNAKVFAEKVALAEAEEAARQLKRQQETEAEKRSLLDHFKKPSGISDEEGIRRAVAIIQRAVSNGLTEVQVYRFPNDLCTDRGRAINQGEKGWEATLTGVPKEIYELWNKYFRDKGYKLKVEIVEFPNGVPGDVGMTLKWG
jgi:hypothetical protein